MNKQNQINPGAAGSAPAPYHHPVTKWIKVEEPSLMDTISAGDPTQPNPGSADSKSFHFESSESGGSGSNGGGSVWE